MQRGLNHYFIDDQNILWGTGRNHLWQLGIEDENDRSNLDTVYSEPVQIAEPVKLMGRVKFVSAGRQSLSILDEDGTVWWWGRFHSTTGTEAGSVDLTEIENSGRIYLIFMLLLELC